MIYLHWNIWNSYTVPSFFIFTKSRWEGWEPRKVSGQIISFLSISPISTCRQGPWNTKNSPEILEIGVIYGRFHIQGCIIAGVEHWKSLLAASVLIRQQLFPSISQLFELQRDPEFSFHHWQSMVMLNVNVKVSKEGNPDNVYSQISKLTMKILLNLASYFYFFQMAF